MMAIETIATLALIRAVLYRIRQLWSPLPHKLTADESTGRRLLRYGTAAWYVGVYLLWPQSACGDCGGGSSAAVGVGRAALLRVHRRPHALLVQPPDAGSADAVRGPGGRCGRRVGQLARDAAIATAYREPTHAERILLAVGHRLRIGRFAIDRHRVPRQDLPELLLYSLDHPTTAGRFASGW